MAAQTSAFRGPSLVGGVLVVFDQHLPMLGNGVVVRLVLVSLAFFVVDDDAAVDDLDAPLFAAFALEEQAAAEAPAGAVLGDDVLHLAHRCAELVADREPGTMATACPSAISNIRSGAHTHSAWPYTSGWTRSPVYRLVHTGWWLGWSG